MTFSDNYPEEGPITLEEYEALPESESGRTEVHDGRLVRMSGTSALHGAILDELNGMIYNQIRTANRPCMKFSSTFDVKLSADPLVILEPDLMIVRDPGKVGRRYYEGGPAIVMEIVSPSSVYNDYFYKLAMYCRYGVKEYWIIDPMKEKVTVYFFEDTLYPEVYTFRNTVASRVCPAIRIDFAEICRVLRGYGLL